MSVWEAICPNQLITWLKLRLSLILLTANTFTPEQTIICRQLFAGHVIGFRSMKRENKGAFVWDQSGIRIIGIMQGSVCLGAILIPEYLDSILAILL